MSPSDRSFIWFAVLFLAAIGAVALLAITMDEAALEKGQALLRGT